MRAAVYYGKNDLRVEEVAKPSVGKKDVLIKVHVCGICGTDVHIFNGGQVAAKCSPGRVLGHEFAGEVVEIGADVTRYREGDRVCVDPNILCGDCEYCRSGIGHFCDKMTGIGTMADGAFAEYCSVPESQVYKIADTTSFLEAAMTEPLACCLHGIDMCEIEPGGVVAVFGAGMIGLLMIQLAKLKGASRIISIEPVEVKRNEALKLGADIAIDPLTEDIIAVLEREKINRVSTVIECVGRVETMKQAVEIAGKKSVVMLYGLSNPDEELAIKPFDLFKKEIVIKASYINPYTQQRALSLIEAGKIDVKSMIYKVMTLEDLPKVLGDAEVRKKGKIIIGF